ncbi:MAG: 2-hydroxyacid dehydrogenase [Gammaproteobacteria bacterium]|nr:2-hydroxyacid dehydrogenase [Gammaproteobacteria bacterium]
MKVIMFHTQNFEREYFIQANQKYKHTINFLDIPLTLLTAKLTKGYPCVCCFGNDPLDASVLKELAKQGVKLLALRTVGFDHVDLNTAKKLKLTVAHVPNYSPYAVAEHAVGLILSLNRKIYRAHIRVQEHNFSLNGLTGFDLYDTTVGVIGTGRIGSIFARIMTGFGCHVLAYDPHPNPGCEALGVKYTPLEDLLSQSKIISLHCPLTEDTYHLIGPSELELMQPGVMLINTGRGALLDTRAIIQALKTRKIGFLGLDVYEEEKSLFFENHSLDIIQDDIFARLLSFPNVLITAHQGFLTEQALANIAQITLANIFAFETGKGKIYLVN